MQSCLSSKKTTTADSYSGNLSFVAYQHKTRKYNTEYNYIIETPKIRSAKADMFNREQSLIDIPIYYDHTMDEQTHETVLYI